MTIEHVLAFNTEADAIADTIVGAYHSAATEEFPAAWRGDVCIPGIKCWDARNDVTGTDSDGIPIVTHTYLPGWWICIGHQHVHPELRDHPNCRFVSDHDAREAGAVVGVWLLKSVVSNEDAIHYQVSP